MTKRFEAHIHCGDGGEHYHDGIIDNLDKSKRIIRNYHSISVIMNNIWEQTQRFEEHKEILRDLEVTTFDKKLLQKEKERLYKENKQLKMHMKSAKDYLEGGYTKKAIERLQIAGDVE